MLSQVLRGSKNLFAKCDCDRIGYFSTAILFCWLSWSEKFQVWIEDQSWKCQTEKFNMKNVDQVGQKWWYRGSGLCSPY